MCGDKPAERRDSVPAESPAELPELSEPKPPAAENWLEYRRRWMEDTPLEHRWRVSLVAAAIALAIVMLCRHLL